MEEEKNLNPEEENNDLGNTETTSSSAMADDEEYVEAPTVKSISMKWGLYLGLVMIAYGLVLQVAGQVGNQALGAVNYIFLIIGMWMAHKEFKDNGNGYMSYSQGLGIGTLLTLVSGGISIVFSYIYVKFIDDSMLGIVKDQQIEQLESQGMSDAQIEQAMEFSAPFMTPEFIFPMALVVLTIVGFVISLIVSAITKNADPSLEA